MARKNHKRSRRPKPQLPDGVRPLAVGTKGAAAILDVSPLTIRLWTAQGILRPLDLPSTRQHRAGNRRLRRNNYAVDDLEALVDAAKARG